MMPAAQLDLFHPADPARIATDIPRDIPQDTPPSSSPPSPTDDPGTPTGTPEAPPAVALDPRLPLCPQPAAPPAAPPTTLSKIEKWLYVAAAVAALGAVTAEKLDSILAGRTTVTP